jgi:hypothetical protein
MEATRFRQLQGIQSFGFLKTSEACLLGQILEGILAV